jgi:hypothetical protein
MFRKLLKKIASSRSLWQNLTLLQTRNTKRASRISGKGSHKTSQSLLGVGGLGPIGIDVIPEVEEALVLSPGFVLHPFALIEDAGKEGMLVGVQERRSLSDSARHRFIFGFDFF